jgi:hypothetical protein
MDDLSNLLLRAKELLEYALCGSAGCGVVFYCALAAGCLYVIWRMKTR